MKMKHKDPKSLGNKKSSPKRDVYSDTSLSQKKRKSEIMNQKKAKSKKKKKTQNLMLVEGNIWRLYEK